MSLKSSIIISGATGWLGRELINVLEKSRLGVINLELISSACQDLKVSNKIYKTTIFANSTLINPDIYFDFAFLTREKINTVGVEKFKQINNAIISQSVDLIRMSQPKTVILASSGAVYGLGRRDKVGNNYLYSELKRIQEDKISEVCLKTGTKLIIIRVFNLSGSGIRKINTFAIAEMISHALKNKPILIKSNFLVYRRYSDVSQLLELLLAANRSNFTGILDSGGVTTEIHELAQTIINQLNSRSRLSYPQLDKNLLSDNYYSKSNLYEELLKKFTSRKPLSLNEQIENTKNFLTSDC